MMYWAPSEEYTGNHFHTKYNIHKEIGRALGELVKGLDELESTIHRWKENKKWTGKL